MYSWGCLYGGDILKVFECDIDQNKETKQNKGCRWRQVMVHFLLKGVSQTSDVLSSTVCLAGSMKMVLEPPRWSNQGSCVYTIREIDSMHCCLAWNYLTLKSTNQLAQFHSKARAPDHVKSAKWIWKVPGCVLILVLNIDILFLPWMSWKLHWFVS